VRISVRCLNKYCGRRSTKSKPFHHYINRPKCKHCGSFVYLDRYRSSGREAGHNKVTGKTCCCGAPDYPHRLGSHVYCHHWPEYRERQIDEQIERSLLDKQVPASYYSYSDDPPF